MRSLVAIFVIAGCAAHDSLPPKNVEMFAAPPTTPIVVGPPPSTAAPPDIVAATELKQYACSEETGLSSDRSDDTAEITFANDTNDVVEVLWLDFTGSRVLYNTITPGSSYMQNTYTTHPWMLIGAKGCLGIIVAAVPGEHRVVLSKLR